MDNKSYYFKKRAYDLLLKKQEENASEYDKAVLELYQKYIELHRKDSVFDIEKIKEDSSKEILEFYKNKNYNGIYSLKNFIYGLKPYKTVSAKILDSVNNKELYFMEDAFLRSVIGFFHVVPNEKQFFQASCGYIIDDLTNYFDSTRPSRMEIILNSDFQVDEKQILRAKVNIDKIIKNKISKYNNQPIKEIKIGRDNAEKVLVIDQSYNDYSIVKGCADDTTFKYMLECAIKENPDADIIIKTHPDSIGEDAIKPKCYYQNIKEEGNIYRITEAINPISIIEYADKVYVCTSQFGFEALMCKKEVHTFGMPFYAGWGLTIDAQKCKRRTRKRTLEEIFYIAYIYMTQYINPELNTKCEIEEAIDYLIKYREKFFKEENK